MPPVWNLSVRYPTKMLRTGDKSKCSRRNDSIGAGEFIGPSQCAELQKVP
jgi:hypothetical protein